MKKNDPRRYRYSLHGDIKIDTRSNRKTMQGGCLCLRACPRWWSCVARPAVRTDRTSWLCDTVLFSTAESMVADFATG